jgi:hypothetical protein
MGEVVTVAVIAAQVVLGAILGVAGTAKLWAPAPFQAVLRTSGLPVAWARFAATVVPVAETATAIALFSLGGLLLRVTFALASALFLAFTGWMLLVRARRLNVSCGCFGSRANRVDWQSITRGAALAAIAGSCAVSGGGLYEKTSPPSIVIGTVLVALVAAVVVMRRIRHVLVLTERDFERFVSGR